MSALSIALQFLLGLAAGFGIAQAWILVARERAARRREMPWHDLDVRPRRPLEAIYVKTHDGWVRVWGKPERKMTLADIGVDEGGEGS